MNKLETPDTVNPLSPPRGPINAVPPTVTSKMNRNDATIVPNAPASAAFHIPPNIPS